MTRAFFNPNKPAIVLQKVVPIHLGGTASTTIQDAQNRLGYINTSELGQRNGVGILNANGEIPNEYLPDIIPVHKGGTGGTTLQEAEQNLGFISKLKLNQPNGIATLNAQTKLTLEQLDLTATPPLVNIEGPTQVYQHEVVQYTITDYDSFTIFNCSTNNGTVTQSGNIITFQPTTVGQASLTINGRTVQIAVIPGSVNKPTITSPANNATDLNLSPTLTANVFTVNGPTQTHTQTRWEIASDVTFTTIIQSDEGSNNLTSWLASSLPMGTTFYARVRYQGSTTGWSEWSDPITFTTTSRSYWLAKLKGVNSTYFYSVDMDASGNYYTAGYHQNIQTNGSYSDKCLLVKYDPTGSVVWQKSFGINYARFKTVKVYQGFIYAVGVETDAIANNQGVVVKFDLDGTIIWQKYIGGTKWDELSHIDVDSTGHLYISGYSTDAANNDQLLLVKMDTSGNFIWSKTVPHVYYGYAYGVVIDQNDNIYICGGIGYTSYYTSGGFLYKFDTNGAVVWERMLNYTNQYTEFYALDVDSAGNIYTTGYQYNSTISYDSDIVLVKWDPSGNVVWQKSLGVSYDEYAQSIHVDSTDHIYIAADSSSHYDACIFKFDNNGNLIWTIKVGEAAPRYYPYEIKSTPQNDLILVGYAGNASYYYDGLIVKIPNTGDVTLGPMTAAGLTAVTWSTNSVTSVESVIPFYNLSYPVQDAVVTSGDGVFTVTDLSLTAVKGSL